MEIMCEVVGGGNVIKYRSLLQITCDNLHVGVVFVSVGS